MHMNIFGGVGPLNTSISTERYLSTVSPNVWYLFSLPVSLVLIKSTANHAIGSLSRYHYILNAPQERFSRPLSLIFPLKLLFNKGWNQDSRKLLLPLWTRRRRKKKRQEPNKKKEAKKKTWDEFTSNMPYVCSMKCVHFHTCSPSIALESTTSALNKCNECFVHSSVA